MKIPYEVRLVLFTFIVVIATLQWIEFTYGDNVKESSIFDQYVTIGKDSL
jgi:hypothetical protein